MYTLVRGCLICRFIYFWHKMNVNVRFYFAETCLFHGISMNNRNYLKKDDRKPKRSQMHDCFIENILKCPFCCMSNIGFITWTDLNPKYIKISWHINVVYGAFFYPLIITTNENKQSGFNPRLWMPAVKNLLPLFSSSMRLDGRSSIQNVASWDPQPLF